MYGATYYACKHNRNAEHDTSLLITFEADILDVIVDGRDFLYTLFQLGNPTLARPIAKQLFGPEVLRYVERAWSTNDQDQRIALCRLAVQDDAVIRAHATNHSVIGGRYSTKFRSAFLVHAPVRPERIVDVRVVDANSKLPDVQITLDMIRN